MTELMQISNDELKGVLKSHIDESYWEYNNWDLIISRAEYTDEFFEEYGDCYRFPCYQVDLVLKVNGAVIQAEPHFTSQETFNYKDY